ncbi:uncharacterized protein LOC132546243 [Ylistrum balloti]|uniref:uncharacterized protein LOC132546243 n=1 Tax=Ylistrum balloti TaxID=509963 RepID=UPI0029059880|nr:uncharacterized protein LOC132546243 [Ylistrum balloti]
MMKFPVDFKTFFCSLLLVGFLLNSVIWYGWLLDFFVTKEPNHYSTKLKSELHYGVPKNNDYHTGACQIPHLDPFEPTIKKFIKVKKHYQCKKWNILAYQKHLQIVVNKTAIERHYKIFSKCVYQPYVKAIGTDRRSMFLKNKFLNFSELINVTDEFCLVRCFGTNNTLLTEQHFAFVVRNETLVNSRNKVRSTIQDTGTMVRRPMNVVMIGLESTSHMNFIRHMNFTRSFLTKTMGSVDLLGYNKAGLNTYPNILLMLLGITKEELNDTKGFFDNYPFIWKDFMKAGYVTFMGEDSSDIATFHYLKKGFHSAPVDYYLRPFVMGLETSRMRNGLCSGNSLILQSIFDKLAAFITTYQHVPHFTFTFVTNPSHDNPNGVGVVDLPLTRTLTDLNARGLLDNTVLLIFGDHGSRYGQIRNTYQGRLEEHLPAFYVSLPRWFRREHRNLYENLKENRNKLTSNVDVFATLHDILELGKGHMTPRVAGKYGTSLLRNISTNRTCDDLKIPTNFCICKSIPESYSTNTSIVHEISQWIVKNINLILKDVHRMCSNLKLNIIHNAWRSLFKPHNTGNVNTEGEYVIQFNVVPSFAEFEATVRYYKKQFLLLGDILRLNKYSGQSDCVLHHKNASVLERYCYCK